jgi:hypothetical protein
MEDMDLANIDTTNEEGMCEIQNKYWHNANIASGYCWWWCCT